MLLNFIKLKGYGLLNYNKLAVNSNKVKKVIDYHLRGSLIYTLAGKHKKNIHKINKMYEKTPQVVLIKDDETKVLARFLSPNNINHAKRGFLINYDPFEYRSYIDFPIAKLSVLRALFLGKCEMDGCPNPDIEFIISKL